MRGDSFISSGEVLIPSYSVRGSGDKRVIRGGSWAFDGNSARCGLRYTHAPKDRGYSLGFRVAADRLP